MCKHLCVMVLHWNKQVSLPATRIVSKSTKDCQYGCLRFLLRQWCNHHDHTCVSMLEAIPHALHNVHGNRQPEIVTAGLVYLHHLHKWDSIYCCCRLICACLNKGLNFLAQASYSKVSLQDGPIFLKNADNVRWYIFSKILTMDTPLLSCWN